MSATDTYNNFYARFLFFKNQSCPNPLQMNAMISKNWLPSYRNGNSDVKRPPSDRVRLSARVSICHLLNHLNHFPMIKEGAQMHTSVQEQHDQLPTGDSLAGSIDESELSTDVFNQPNVQLFVVDRSILMTFVTLPYPPPPSDDTILVTVNMGVDNGMIDKSRFITDRFYTRVIMRDLVGKYCWDASYLHGLGFPNSDYQELSNSNATADRAPCPPPRLNPHPPPLKVPSSVNSGPTSDVLNVFLHEIDIFSPECLVTWGVFESGDCGQLTATSQSDKIACNNLERMTLDQISAQLQLDDEVVEQCSNAAVRADGQTQLTSDPTLQLGNPHPTSNPMPDHPTPTSAPSPNNPTFDTSRHLLNQMGFLSWRYRSSIELLDKSSGLVRELKYLDKLRVRESHKVAVIYVGAGQQDKASILANQTASLEFENFVAGLGYEVPLATHGGFMGGLERSGRVGLSTPYYATSTMEVIFHVSTRMPTSTQEDYKYKHLGNDDVIIIWNENARSFRRSVLRTQFGDVLIIISPLSNGLFHVHVRRESQVGVFGPIVESAILTRQVLPRLVRATAINASRAIHSLKPGYQNTYEDRAQCLQQIMTKYCIPTCFEDFSKSFIIPSAPLQPNIASLVDSIATNPSSKLNSVQANYSGSSRGGSFATSNNLTAVASVMSGFGSFTPRDFLLNRNPNPRTPSKSINQGHNPIRNIRLGSSQTHHYPKSSLFLPSRPVSLFLPTSANTNRPNVINILADQKCNQSYRQMNPTPVGHHSFLRSTKVNNASQMIEPKQ